jgi:diguanylate cyclase (GGDEF)-like protein
MLWLAPFAVFRALEGNWIAAVSDAVLAGVLGGSAWHAWRTGNTHWPGWIMAISIVGGIWVIGAVAKFAALFWVFPAVLMMFFLVPSPAAAVLGVASVAGAAALSWGELGGAQGLPFFVVTSLLTGFFGFLVSQQAHSRIARWQTLSLIDPLTGIGNRRLMEVEFAQAFTATGSGGILVLLDLDHFKRINDQLGHDTGDAVLREVSTVVPTVLRKTDRLYRIGGEEFVIWLPYGDESAASAMMERVRDAVRLQVHAGEHRVTFSAGMARHYPSEPWEACLARADAALYKAKGDGRDRVLWSATHPGMPERV